MHQHEKLVNRVREEMPWSALGELSDLFHLFGDPTRAKILSALSVSELCVCAISELLEMTQPAVSYQLKVLKEGNLVGCRREGKTVIYFLADDHVHHIMAQGLAHVKEEKV